MFFSARPICSSNARIAVELFLLGASYGQVLIGSKLQYLHGLYGKSGRDYGACSKRGDYRGYR